MCEMMKYLCGYRVVTAEKMWKTHRGDIQLQTILALISSSKPRNTKHVQPIKLVLFTNLFYKLSLKIVVCNIVLIKIFKDFQIFLQTTASYIAFKVEAPT